MDLNKSSFLERLVSAVLVDSLETASAHLYADVAAKLRNPDALLTQVGLKLTLHSLRDVAADATLFFRLTTAVDSASGGNFSTSNFTYSSHREDLLNSVSRFSGPDFARAGNFREKRRGSRENPAD